MNSNQVSNLFTADQLVLHLVDADWDDRHNRKLARVLKSARFRYRATFEEIDFAVDRNLDKNQMLGFLNGYCPERGTIGLICCHGPEPTSIKIALTCHNPERST